ncbi:MAG: carbohydrate ABC transporter permease [Clostridiaceae bacterium]|nr:carbohydrate ABC transporter permease [Clostridiaceae bacterium]
MAAIKERSGDKVFNIVNFTLTTLFMLIVLYPLIYIVSASISNPDLVNTGKMWLYPVDITFEGYYRVFQDPEILKGYANTIIYAVGGTLINLFFTLTAAYALSKSQLIGRKFFMVFITFTMYFSGGMIPSYLLMRSLNLLNTYTVLMVCGAISTTNLIIARTFFINGVPREVEEAAFIDGCSPLKTFTAVVIPLSKALIGVMALYYGVGHWNSWFSAMIYLTDRSKIPLQLILREILIQNQMKAEMMAAGEYVDELLLDAQVKAASLVRYSVIIVSSLPVLIIYPFLQRYFDKGVMIGSLKG